MIEWDMQAHFRYKPTGFHASESGYRTDDCMAAFRASTPARNGNNRYLEGWKMQWSVQLADTAGCSCSTHHCAVSNLRKPLPSQEIGTMSEPIISVSGLRGTIGNQLTPLVASRYVAALPSTLPAADSSGNRKGLVVIGRDGRQSGSMLAQADSATLRALGMDVVDLGVAATPTVGVQVRVLSAVAGIQISASHNPQEYNGLKLFNADGRVFPKIDGERVLAAYRSATATWAEVDGLGAYCEDIDPHAAHCALVLKTVDAEAIRQKKFKVMLDSNHGAGSLLGRKLLEFLDCDLTLLGETPDGKFSHPPEPLAENLVSVSKQAKGNGYDVVFCQDPDADRLAIIDENGNFIGEELTLALCLMQVLPKQSGPHQAIVINCATSGLAKSLADKHSCRCLQSAVGEANVADLMLQEHAIFGGEGNGGPIDPQVGFVRDSFVGMARILELMATSGQTISQLVGQLPPLSMVKDKIEFDTTALPTLFQAMQEQMPDAEVNLLDGLKLEWADRWLLVRGSNTEPIVRFIAEAPTTADARSLCETARQVARELVPTIP